MSSRRQRISFGAFAVVAPVVLAATAAACGGDDAGGTGAAGGADPATIEEGRQIAARSGCTGCHGANGEGGVGPAWTGLAGSQVQLVDGTTVVADEAYLVSAIKTPDAQKVAGYEVAMPANQLPDEEVAAVVAYIQSLAEGPGATPAATGPTAPTIPVATPAPGATAPSIPVATPAYGGG